MKNRIQNLVLAVAALCFCVCMAATSASAQVGTVVTLTGFMLNANTLQPVEASYGLYDANGKQIGQSNRSNAREGYLVTGLKPGQTYVLKIEDPRYFKQEYSVEVPQTSKYVEISKDFIARPREVGKLMAMQPVPFDVKKTSIKVGAESDVQDLARLMVVNQGMNIEIVCYADVEGNGASERISSDRGNALKAALVKAGVQGDRIKVKGTSSTDPLNPPPVRMGAKGKRYVGPVYLTITKV